MSKRLILSAVAALLMCYPMSAASLSVTVNECVERALKTSEEMAVARNSEQQARLRSDVARTAYLPKLDGTAMYGWSLPDYKYEELAMELRMRGIYLAGISLTQPVFAGGKIVAANKMASIGREAAAQQSRLTRMKITADAENAYWTYVAVLAKVDMMRSYKALVDTAYSRTLSSVNAGMATQNSLLRVEARRSQVEYQLKQVESGADLCRMSLCTVIGVDTETALTPADTEIPLDIPADLGVYDLSSRPEMQLLDANVRIKEQQVRLTRGDYLPTLGLSAGWSAYGNIRLSSMAQGPDGNYYPVEQNIKNNGFNIMLALQVPLFHWGEGIKKVKDSKLDVANARLDLDHSRRMMNLEVQQAISNVTTGQHLLESAQIAMTQADASLKETSVSYKAGMCTLTEMLDAQSQWHTSRANLIEAQTQLRINIIEYRRVTATL